MGGVLSVTSFKQLPEYEQRKVEGAIAKFFHSNELSEEHQCKVIKQVRAFATTQRAFSKEKNPQIFWDPQKKCVKLFDATYFPELYDFSNKEDAVLGSFLDLDAAHQDRRYQDAVKPTGIHIDNVVDAAYNCPGSRKKGGALPLSSSHRKRKWNHQSCGKPPAREKIDFH